MIRTTYKVAMVKQRTAYIETCECDRCGKVIYKRPKWDFTGLENTTNMHNPHDVSYYQVTTGHNDWGHDSVDSIEQKQVCPSCLVNIYAAYVDRASVGSNTEYIKIEHHVTYSYDINVALIGEDVEEVTE